MAETENLTPEQREQINAYLFAGQKIQAFKVLREATGVDLATAKQAIEAHEKALRESSPEKFSAPSGKGCATCILVALAIGTPLVLLIWGLGA
ncbi:MAG: hypothetical protein ACM359_07035 [Bacillota bacterium]